jgi:type VI secretion system secreted protein VgrG
LPQDVEKNVHEMVEPVFLPTGFAESEGQAIAIKQAAVNGKPFCKICSERMTQRGRV